MSRGASARPGVSCFGGFYRLSFIPRASKSPELRNMGLFKSLRLGIGIYLNHELLF